MIILIHLLSLWHRENINSHMEEIVLTNFQFKKMCSAIRLSQAKIKDGVAQIYRNRFIVNSFDEDWMKLVDMGLANSIVDGGQICYSLSAKGIQMIEDVTGFNIVEIE